MVVNGELKFIVNSARVDYFQSGLRVGGCFLGIYNSTVVLYNVRPFDVAV